MAELQPWGKLIHDPAQLALLQAERHHRERIKFQRLWNLVNLTAAITALAVSILALVSRG